MENSYFLFIILFIHINSQQKINPIHLIKDKYPFVISTTDNYYYVIAKEKCLKIQKETGNTINARESKIINSQNYVYITDNSNNNYLYYQYGYYNIIYDPFISFVQINVNPKPPKTPNMKRIGGIAQNESFIIYGYTKDSIRQLVFSSIPENNRNIVDDIKLIDKLSCKFIEGDLFICAIIINNNLHLHILKYYFDSVSSNNTFILVTDLDTYVYNSFSSLGLYDTDKNDIKLLCSKKLDTLIQCRFIKIKNNPIIIQLIGNYYLIFTTTYNFDEKNCYLSQFNSEYLFCCALSNLIKCFRIDKDSFDIINEFNIQQEGDNSYLTIKSNNDYITLFYMNEYNEGMNIYEYYIYFPTCENKNYIILNSLNENKSEEEKERINNLFNIKTNRYYFELKKLPDEFGYFTLNNEKNK